MEMVEASLRKSIAVNVSEGGWEHGLTLMYWLHLEEWLTDSRTVYKGRHREAEETEYIGVPRSGSVSVRAAVLRFSRRLREIIKRNFFWNEGELASPGGNCSPAVQVQISHKGTELSLTFDRHASR